MLTPQQLRPAQREAALHQLFHDKSMLWLGCGRGKTCVTLTTIEHRQRAGLVKKTLIVAPLRVCHAVWEREARKWSHTQHLRFSMIAWPSEKKRQRALFTDADIYLINYENLGWLSNTLKHYYLDQDKPLPFEMVVYDEITRVKDSTSKRIAGGKRRRRKESITPDPEPLLKAGWTLKQLVEQNKVTVTPAEYTKITGWRKIIPHFKYATGLTGTPASNGYLDLHGQYLVIDNGERLGPCVTHYKDSFFSQAYDGWSYEITRVGKELIEQKISDITIQMDDVKSSIPVMINDIPINLSDKVMEKYREVEKEMFTRLDDGTEIELFNRASVSNKCLQFCDGTPYKAPGEPEHLELHDEKLLALDSIIEESGGNTVMVGYRYRSDAERIMKRYKHLNPVNLTKTKSSELRTVMDAGVAGKIKLMIGHPASLGHGIDGLQDFCCNMVWYGLPWSFELYHQMNGRIAEGERLNRPVTIHRLVATDTLDVAVVDALRRKDTDQNGLKQAMSRYRCGVTPKDGSINFM